MLTSKLKQILDLFSSKCTCEFKPYCDIKLVLHNLTAVMKFVTNNMLHFIEFCTCCPRVVIYTCKLSKACTDKH